MRVQVRLTAVIATLAAVTTSCGGGHGSASPTPGGTAVPSAIPTFSPADLTAADPGYNLTRDYRDAAARYTVKLPEGWQLQQSENLVTASITVPVTSTAPGAPAVAVVSLGIMCQPGMTAADLIAQDQLVLKNTNAGSFDASQGQVVPVAGTTGQEIGWAGSSLIPLTHISVYFEGHGCAWRVMLTAFPGADIQAYRPILDRTLQTFQFTP